MTNRKKHFIYFLLYSIAVIMLVFTSCTASELTLDDDPVLRYTEAAQTVFVQLTRDAPTVTPTPTLTVTREPSTPTPTVSTPTATQEPSATPQVDIEPTSTRDLSNELIDLAQLVLSYPPVDQIFTPGTVFTAQVGFSNAGPNTWNSGYSLRFLSGNSFGAAGKYTLASNGSQTAVSPGGEVVISIPFMTAPMEPGTYLSNWCFYNNREAQDLPPQCFYIVSFQIIVQQ